ncbi:methyltransferase domain-containing protein [Microvirga sp. M2]|uniref:methyltransferase domain-containing protein n=1 Tax=Microvirga sp. M2 TaxID=3073270 RepID=UPI0039C0E814
MGIGLSRRSDETELMDTESVSLEDYRACLEDLARVNVLTLTHRPILAWLDRATRDMGPTDRVTVLDVGYGYGDLLRRIHQWSRRRKRNVRLIGIDLNPYSETIARAATPQEAQIDFRIGNVFQFTSDRPIDFIVCSQTAHHMTHDELVRLIRWMEHAAVRGWFIADLHRHGIPFHAFRLLSRLAGWHRFVRHDGPVSIARSFRRADWELILRDAGLDLSAVRIRWHMPFRLCVSRLK